MSRLSVLQSYQALFQAEYDRVFIYPDEIDDMENDPTDEFFVLQELISVENITDVHTSDGFQTNEWIAHIIGYIGQGEFSPGRDEAPVLERAFVVRDKMRELLQTALKPRGAVMPVGWDDGRTFSHGIGPWSWNKQPWLAVVFEVSVTSE